MKLAILIGMLLGFVMAPLAPADEAPAAKGPVYHVVAVKFKEGTSPEKIKAIEQAFAELKTKIPFVQTLHWGTNVSPEQKNKGFTHCFVLTFATQKDRDAYLVDPAHKAFVELAGPSFEDVLVIDFESR